MKRRIGFQLGRSDRKLKGERGVRISNWLLFVSGVAFACGAHPADLGQVMVDAVAEHLPRDAVPLTATERADLIWAGNHMPTFAHHELDTRAAKRSVRDAISRAAASGDASASSLARAGIESILRSMGHGASLLDLPGGKAGAAQPATPAVSFRQHESLRIVSLVRLEAEFRCNELLKEALNGSYDAIVLDLRGNGGGELKAVAVVAGQFLPPQAIFKTISNEQTEDVYAAPNCRSEPVTQPLAIWIDQQTDSGAALLAAALQDQGRAKVIGDSKAQMNGAFFQLVLSPSRALFFLVPVGELARINDVPLSAGVRPDVSVTAADEAALIRETIALIPSGSPSNP